MAEVEGTGTVSIDPKKWWVVALLGAISIVAGVLALAYPDITLLVLGLIVGINLVLIGAVWVALATMEDHTAGGRVLRIGLTTLALLAGIAFIVRGTVELMAGLYMRRLAQ
jgi:uncharacterized membrane protein HdeD (DUF308 family)